MKKAVVPLSLIAVLCTFSLAAAAYRLTGLGFLAPTIPDAYSHAEGINDFDQIVGRSLNASSFGEAFLWQNGVMRGIGELPGGDSGSIAWGINNSGVIVGSSDSLHGEEAFIYQNGKMNGLGDFRGGMYLSQAYEINDSGTAVGMGNDANGMRGFYAHGKLSALKHPSGVLESGAYGINAAGVIVGGANPQGPFVYRRGKMTFLAGGSGAALAINDLGQITGHCRPPGTQDSQACYWENADSSPVILGNLGGLYASSSGWAINNAGQVVGYSHSGLNSEAFIWDGANGLRSLNSLLDASGSGWFLHFAFDINNNGYIVGEGTNPTGQTEAFLLMPVP